MSYVWLKRVVLGSLIGYFAISFALDSVSQREIYPFFSWLLFPRIPSETQRDYTVRLLSYDGKSYNPPLFFSQTKSILKSNSHSSPVDQLPVIRELGRAVESKDVQRISDARTKFERAFTGPVRYEVLSVVYDPLELWRHGTYKATRIIETFESSL